MSNSAPGQRVALMAFGTPDPVLLWFVAQGLGRYLPAARAIIDPTVQLSADFAVDPKRGQARAEMLLDRLALVRPAGTLGLGLCNEDIYAPGFAYVFGISDPGRGVAVVSLARLNGGPGHVGERDDLRRIRALKEAIHEVGHLVGLGHCRNSSCIMHFSGSVAASDRKGPDFCPRCRAKVGG